MPDSNPTNPRSRNPESNPESNHDPVLDVPEELKDLDRALGRTLSPLAEVTPIGLADRIFEVSVEELPTRVLAFQEASSEEAGTRARRVRIPYLGYAAMILVAVLSYLALVNRDDDPGVGRELAAGTTLATFQIEEPRESETMLMAVLDPSEDWFGEDEDFGDQFVTGVGAVLQTRGFGVDDLSGDVIAMLGGSPS